MNQFQKQCSVCGSTHWCILSNNHWVCMACVEDDIEQTWLNWEEQRVLGEEE